MSTRVPSSPPCGLLPWDSEFFHCRFARIHGDTLNEAQMLAVEEWGRSQQVQALYFLARVGCLPTVRTAQNHQFDLVDIRVTFERKMPKKDDQAVSQPGPGAVIRPARPQDVPGLQAIARAAHRDTRFFSDPHFPRALAESLYSTWISLE